MNTLSPSLTSPPSAAEAAIDPPNPRFRSAQRRMLFAVGFCYLFYYTGRQTFGFAIPGIQAELGISKADLGWISALMLWCYAAGQAVNGNLGDKFGGRAMMALGGIFSFCLNWLVSLASSFGTLASAWGLNGFAQSMGWAPGSRVVSNWFSAKERGRAFGFYLFAAGLSSILSFCSSLIIVQTLQLSWRWIFRLPVALMLVGSLIVWLVARNHPRDLGMTSPDPEQRKADAEPTETMWQRYGIALSNPKLWLAGLAVGFQNAARYGLLIWVPVYFLGANFAKSPGGRWVSIALPVGMAAGAICTGWISDRFCGSRRSGVIALFLALASACSLAMWALPQGSWLGIPMLCLAGFFTYGPQAAFWALSPDLLGAQRSGTGVGIMNFFAYAIAGFGEPLLGWLIQHNPFGATPGVENTALVFPVVAAYAAIGTLLALPIRR